MVIYRSIASTFGGLTKLDAKARIKRAKKASKARWQREKENSNN
jgi:hypothetical protein